MKITLLAVDEAANGLVWLHIRQPDANETAMTLPEYLAEYELTEIQQEELQCVVTEILAGECEAPSCHAPLSIYETGEVA